MQLMRWIGVVVVAMLGIQARGGEMEIRESIKAETAQAFTKGDYAAIEARYAKALSSSERTSSGLLVANLIRLAAVPDPSGDSQVPGRGDHWDAVDRKLDVWARQFPKSSLVAIVQSESFQGRARSWRGGGYARTVPPEAWSKVREYARRAFDALMAREEAGRQDPYWYVEMINATRLDAWPADRFTSLVLQATEAHPLNYDIYFAAVLSLVPRWGGSTTAVAQFADYAVTQTRKSEGQAMYARIYWAIADSLDAEFSGPKVDWKRIRVGFDDIVKRYPDAWNLNNYAKFACEARDYTTAKRVLARIGEDIDPRAWGSRANFVRCRQLAEDAR